MARIAIVMGGARCTIDVGIAEDEDFPVLLGTDFIDRYVAYHNVKEGWLQLIGEKKRVPIKTYEDGNGRSADMVAALAITSQSTIKRDHAQLLTVRTVVRLPKLACVEFGTIPLVTGALLESGVIGEEQWKKVGCSYWTTEVFIRNLLPRHLHLRAGQIVGKVYEIKEEDADLIECTPSNEATAKQKNPEVIAMDAKDGEHRTSSKAVNDGTSETPFFLTFGRYPMAPFEAAYYLPPTDDSSRAPTTTEALAYRAKLREGIEKATDVVTRYMVEEQGKERRRWDVRHDPKKTYVADYTGDDRRST
ncbi:hypothetical protein HK102_005570 [Quaeritorhiza haematococci]|nr:hypothetical protein HK102_005570 [Quaeritorhiza haematococci]